MSSTQDNSASEQSQSPTTSSNGNTPAPSTAATTASNSSNAAGADESLICRWNQCNLRFNTPETLYVSWLLHIVEHSDDGKNES